MQLVTILENEIKYSDIVQNAFVFQLSDFKSPPQSQDEIFIIYSPDMWFGMTLKGLQCWQITLSKATRTSRPCFPLDDLSSTGFSVVDWRVEIGDHSSLVKMFQHTEVYSKLGRLINHDYSSLCCVTRNQRALPLSSCFCHFRQHTLSLFLLCPLPSSVLLLSPLSVQ